MKIKYSTLIAVVIILTSIQACSTGNNVQPTKIEPEATLAEEQNSPTITSTLVQDTPAEDSLAGPDTIDLQNSALYITTSSKSYKFNATMDFSGVDENGAIKDVTLSMTEETQTIPQNEIHYLVEVIGGEGSAETVILGDEGFSVFLGICNTFSASSSVGQSVSEGMPKLQEMITGQAKLVESGIEVNGFVTDKYKLASENMIEDDEVISAYVFVTRDGGFITQFEIQGRAKTDYQGFDSNQVTDVSTSYTYTPVEDGTLDINIPSGCNN